MNRWRTEEFYGSETTLFDIITVDTFIMHLFKPIKCARAWVNPDMHHGLWMTMTCQCRFVCCYQMYRPGERCREWGRLCMSGHRGYGEISIWHSILLWTFKAAQKNKVCQNGGVVRKKKEIEMNQDHLCLNLKRTTPNPELKGRKMIHLSVLKENNSTWKNTVKIFNSRWQTRKTRVHDTCQARGWFP